MKLKKRDWRKRDKDEWTIGYLGRFEVNKGFEWLLTVWEGLNKKRTKGEKIKLLIAGPRDEGFKRMEKRIRESRQIKYIGLINEKKKKEFFEQVSLLIIPTKGVESYSLTCLESLSFGVPVLANRVGGIEEVLKHWAAFAGMNEGLFLTDETSPQAMEISLKRLMKFRQGENDKLGQKAREFIEECYNFKEQADKIITAYNKVIK